MGDFHHDIMQYYVTRHANFNIKFCNCGIAGDTVSGALTRLSDDVFVHNPSHAFIMFGMNDLGKDYNKSMATREEDIKTDLNNYEENLEQLIAILQEKNVSVALARPSIYDLKPKDDLLSSNPNAADNLGNAKHDSMSISELDLLRAMIRGDAVAGFDVSHYSISIAINSPNLSATLIKVYRGKDLNGYVYHLKVDGSGHYYDIDLKGLAIGSPNLAVISQVDRKKIGGNRPEERESFLRIVAKPGSSGSKMILPVAIKSDSKSEAR